MDVHKLLIGEGAENYLPFAVSRLEALVAIDETGYFSQSFVVDDATINVRLVGDQKYITITMNGGFYFEFVTSAKPIVVKSVVQGSVTFNTYLGCVVATEVTASNGKCVYKPRIEQQRRYQAGENLSLVGFPAQIQLFQELARYPQTSKGQRKRYYHPDIAMASYAPWHSYTGLGARSPLLKSATFSYHPDPGGAGTFNQRDIFYDARWHYSKKRAKATLAEVQGSADWPRATGYQTVTHERFGTRSFGIMIDAFSQVNVFPVGAVTPYAIELTQNIEEQYMRRLNPTLPTWCHRAVEKFKNEERIKTPTQMLIDCPEANWEFDLTGTKAVAVFVARSPFLNDTAYWNFRATVDQPWTLTKFNTTLIPLLSDNAASYNIGVVASGYNNTTRYFYGSGVVEYRITITLLGTGLNDYTVDITVVDVRDPNSTPYSTALAGYSYIDIPKKGVEAGDMVTLDFEGYGFAAETTEQDRPELLSIRNLTKNTEAFCSVAYPVLGVDLSTLSLALKLHKLDRNVMTASRTRGSYTGAGTVNVNWTTEKFGVQIIHSAAHKDLLYPATMTDPIKAELLALTLINGRTYINERITANPAITRVPLAHPKDGWGDTDYNNFREWWSYDQHFWYNQPWILYDADWTVHGTNYPDQGWVRYRDAPGGYVPPSNITALSWLVVGSNSPPNATLEHLFFCSNPRWGWHYYAGMNKQYLQLSNWSTFYTHPNGSYAFWNDQLIYNAQGVPTLGSSTPNTSYEATLVDGLGMFDVAKYEHCIFDKIHFEIRKSVNSKSAVADTTFLKLYNDAVAAGKAAKTLEVNIDALALSDMQGKFTKEIAQHTIISGEIAEILDLKFVWNGKDWWFPEPGIRGSYIPSVEPYLAFSPLTSGGIVSMTLDNYWNEGPEATGPSKRTPNFVDTSNPFALPYRFTNPLIVMG